MTYYIIFGLMLLLALPVGIILSIYLVDALSERSWRSLRNERESLEVLDQYSRTVEVLWANAIEQIEREAEKRPDLKYWIRSLIRLRESDRQLFVQLQRMKANHLHRMLALLVDTGIVDFSEELERETPITLILKGLKISNAAIAAGIENLGYIERKSFAWLKTFCEIKEMFLEKAVSEVERGTSEASLIEV